MVVHRRRVLMDDGGDGGRNEGVGIVFKSPVQSGFLTKFGRTATATGCLL